MSTDNKPAAPGLVEALRQIKSLTKTPWVGDEEREAAIIAILDAALSQPVPSAPEPREDKPIAWWSGGVYGGGDEHGRLSLGTFTEHEDTWHDIPVYAGWNNEGKPSRNAPDTAFSSAPASAPEPSDQVIELAEALQVRRILEEIKKVAALHAAGETPSPFQAAWSACCEEIFYRATGEEWHMDEDGPQEWAARRLKALTTAASNEPSVAASAPPVPAAAPAVEPTDLAEYWRKRWLRDCEPLKEPTDEAIKHAMSGTEWLPIHNLDEACEFVRHMLKRFASPEPATQGAEEPAMDEQEATWLANTQHDDGTVPWRNDPFGRPFKSNDDKPIRPIAAFGCDREVQGGAACPHWCAQAKCGVTLAASPAPEPATQEAAKPVHTDHPFQHWDRTCPACVLEASPPVPEPLTPAAGMSEPPICPHCSKPAFAWPESAIRRGRHVVGGVVVYHCREAAVDD